MVPVAWLINRAARVPIRLAACAAATEETPHPAAAMSPYIDARVPYSREMNHHQ